MNVMFKFKSSTNGLNEQLGRHRYLMDDRDFLFDRPENARRTLLLAPLGLEQM